MLLFLTSLFIKDASALSCEYGLTKYFPGDYTSDSLVLPANFQGALWFAQMDTSNLSWSFQDETGESTNAATIQLEHQGSENIIAFSSDEAMVGPYTLIITGSDIEELISIEVSEQEDTTSPSLPVFVHAEREREDDEWGGYDNILIELEPAEEEIMYKVETSLDGSFEDAVVTHQLAYQEKVVLGRGYCDSNHSSQELDVLHHVRITAIDLAGNESDSLNIELELEPSTEAPAEEAQTGCSSTGANGISSLFSVILAAFAFLPGRRRRR